MEPRHTKQCQHCSGLKYTCCDDPEPETEQYSRRNRVVRCQSCDKVIQMALNRFLPMDAEWLEDCRCVCPKIVGPVWGTQAACRRKRPRGRGSPVPPKLKTKAEIAKEPVVVPNIIKHPITTELQVVKHDGTRLPVVADVLDEVRDWKKHENGRRVALFGNGSYKYTRMVLEGAPKPKFVKHLEDYVRRVCESNGVVFDEGIFQTALVNHYPPRVNIPAHRDNEVEIDQSAGVVSVSLGGADRFVVRPLRKVGKQVETYMLHHGDVAFMPPGFQADWSHQTAGVHRKDRVSVTWRKLTTSGEEFQEEQSGACASVSVGKDPPPPRDT